MYKIILAAIMVNALSSGSTTIDSKMLTKTASMNGDAIIMTDRAIEIAPATILKNILDALLLDLSVASSTILDIASKSRMSQKAEMEGINRIAYEVSDNQRAAV